MIVLIIASITINKKYIMNKSATVLIRNFKKYKYFLF